MSGLKNISFIGGDQRQVYMAEYFSTIGYTVYNYYTAAPSINNCISCQSLEEAVSVSRIIVLPIPISDNNKTIKSKYSTDDLSISKFGSYLNKKHFIFGGHFPLSIKSICAELEVIIYDFMADESIKALNAIATAEGTIMKAISKSPVNLHGSKCLVLGYGKCGSVLAQKLSGLNASVTVCARRSDSRCQAIVAGHNAFSINDLTNINNPCSICTNKINLKEYNFIFNTIPSCILTPDILDTLSHDVVIIDIASYPGGVDFEYATSLNLNTDLFLGIPGIVSPKSSAEILSNQILEQLEQPPSLKIQSTE